MATIMKIMAAYKYIFTLISVSVPMEISKGTLLNIKDFTSKKRITKGTVQRDFYLRFFHRWTSPKPLTQFLKAFRIKLRIRGYIRDF